MNESNTQNIDITTMIKSLPQIFGLELLHYSLHKVIKHVKTFFVALPGLAW